jgi:hypothetical protein
VASSSGEKPPTWWGTYLPDCSTPRLQGPPEGRFSESLREAEDRLKAAIFPHSRTMLDLAKEEIALINPIEQRLEFARRSLETAKSVNMEAKKWIAFL